MGKRFRKQAVANREHRRSKSEGRNVWGGKANSVVWRATPGTVSPTKYPGGVTARRSSALKSAPKTGSELCAEGRAPRFKQESRPEAGPQHCKSKGMCHSPKGDRSKEMKETSELARTGCSVRVH